ncbi:caspase family protein [Lysinibacillus capsici]|uniref:caspase family protein n=1 Tax=Lysinibacillus capsici TaxID=2115968 RepID=UPI0024802934|nr:caspase family protein [Lysinibacillus capsici]
MPERYAILIGINDYLDAPLSYCVNDANAISSTLIDRCLFKETNIYNLTSDLDKSKKEILGELRQALNEIKITFEPNKDSFFFFFAGHGSYSEEKSYIWLHEIQHSIEDIYNEITNVLNPEVQIYVIDACESGGKVITRDKKSKYSLLEKYEATSSGSMLLFACGTNQYAKEYGELGHGLLTNIFIKGIYNDDLYDKDGFITPSILQDYVTKETSKISDFSQIPVYENRISGVYPLAFKIVASDDNFETEVKNKPFTYTVSRELRNDLLTLGKNSIKEKMNNLNQKLITKYENMYEIQNIETLDFRDFKYNYENIDILSEKLYKTAKRDLNLPLNDIFQEIIIKGTTSPFESAFSLRPADKVEYSLNLEKRSVDFRIDIFKAREITESSFGYGVIIYDTKWGISIATLEFRLDWDGYSDRILKDIQTKTLKYKIDNGFEEKINSFNFNESFDFITEIQIWNDNRSAEIAAFLENSL